jgi:hypothetical protein
MTTAMEHFAEGEGWLAAAERQPNSGVATAYAAIATARFAAAAAAVALSADPTSAHESMPPPRPYPKAHRAMGR